MVSSHQRIGDGSERASPAPGTRQVDPSSGTLALASRACETRFTGSMEPSERAGLVDDALDGVPNVPTRRESDFHTHKVSERRRSFERAGEGRKRTRVALGCFDQVSQCWLGWKHRWQRAGSPIGALGVRNLGTRTRDAFVDMCHSRVYRSAFVYSTSKGQPGGRCRRRVQDRSRRCPDSRTNLGRSGLRFTETEPGRRSGRDFRERRRTCAGLRW